MIINKKRLSVMTRALLLTILLIFGTHIVTATDIKYHNTDKKVINEAEVETIVYKYGRQTHAFIHQGNIDNILHNYMKLFISSEMGEPDLDNEITTVYFRYLLKHIEFKDWDILRGLREALKSLNAFAGNFSGSFVLTNCYDLYVYNNQGSESWDIENVIQVLFQDNELPLNNDLYENVVNSIKDISIDMDELVFIPYRGRVQRFKRFSQEKLLWIKTPVPHFYTNYEPEHLTTWDSFPVLDSVDWSEKRDYAIETMTQKYEGGSGKGFDTVWNVMNSDYSSIFRHEYGNCWTYGSMPLHAFNSYSGYEITHYNPNNLRLQELREFRDRDVNSKAIIAGEICKADSIILYPGQENWIGYYLLNSQSVQQAFAPIRDKVHSVQARDWHWINDNASPSHNNNFPMEFGQMYKVRLKRDVRQHFEFLWNNSRKPYGISTEIKDVFPLNKPEYFAWKPPYEYQTIEVNSIEEHYPINEVAVTLKARREILGATVYNGSPMQLLVNKKGYEGLELDFIFWDGEKELPSNHIIERWDNSISDWVELGYGDFLAGIRQYSLIRLVGIRSIEEKDTIIKGIGISNNIFSSDTEISFHLLKREFLEVVVMNIKGQTITTLAGGWYTPGTNRFVWHGKNDNNQTVGSGIYFYRITAGKETITGKMLMLK